MLWMLKVEGLLPVKQQYRFHPERKWAADFCWPEHKLILELQGGTWNNGAHVRGKRFEQDCEKFNEATLLGYRTLLATTDMVHDGRAVNQVRRALSRKPAVVSVPDVEC
jgi:hypothetical protein